MLSIGHVQVVYSGGAANNDQSASLGGAISTDAAKRVLSQEASAPDPTITGVTILDAMGNTEGAGTLRWNATNSQLLWRRYGGVLFHGVEISGNGQYTIGDPSGYLVVDVVAASLPVSTIDSTVIIVGAVNKTFDNISPAQSLSGYVDYRCFYVINTAAEGTAVDVRLWVKNQPIGDDSLSLALDPAGLNGTALTIADEEDTTNQLAGLSWSAPSSQATGIVIGDLTPGDYRAFWIRRTVPEDTYTQVVENKSSLGISALM